MIKIIIPLLLIKNITIAENKKLNIAVASNFLDTSIKISKIFEEHQKYKILISADSTANLFTKIKHKAPFNIYISADKKHVKTIEKLFFFKNKKHLYAKGKIIFLQKNEKIKKQILKKINLYKNIALSNKKLSPYGNSSEKALKNLKINYTKNIIVCTNINQTFSFIFNEVCNFGIVSFSQVLNKKIKKNKYKKIPQYLYPEIKQYTILIKDNKEKINEKFINYMKTNKIKKLIIKQGYKKK
jgi:molybdate transport system substrate-binding protein